MSEIGNVSCETIAANLRKKIADKQFAFGARIPSGRNLAETFGASYVTVNKALRLLEAEGWLESRGTRGFFACYTGPGKLPDQKKVNLICPETGDENAAYMIAQGAALFRSAGWQVELLHPRKTLAELKGRINAPDTFSVIYWFKDDIGKFRATYEHLRERVVFLGFFAEAPFTFITCDESETIRLLMEHFKSCGKFKTAFASAQINTLTTQYQFASWQLQLRRQALPFEWINRHCFLWPNHGDEKSRGEEFLKQCRPVGKQFDFDSIIFQFSNSAQSFVNQVRELGLQVPEDIAVGVIGGSRQQQVPGLVHVDNNFPEHIRLALEILEDRFAGNPTCGTFFTCSPKFNVTA